MRERAGSMLAVALRTDASDGELTALLDTEMGLCCACCKKFTVSGLYKMCRSDSCVGVQPSTQSPNMAPADGSGHMLQKHSSPKETVQII